MYVSSEAEIAVTFQPDPIGDEGACELIEGKVRIDPLAKDGASITLQLSGYKAPQEKMREKLATLRTSANNVLKGTGSKIEDWNDGMGVADSNQGIHIDLGQQDMERLPQLLDALVDAGFMQRSERHELVIALQKATILPQGKSAATAVRGRP